jgi:hypothetical protein
VAGQGQLVPPPGLLQAALLHEEPGLLLLQGLEAEAGLLPAQGGSGRRGAGLLGPLAVQGPQDPGELLHLPFQGLLLLEAQAYRLEAFLKGLHLFAEAPPGSLQGLALGEEVFFLVPKGFQAEPQGLRFPFRLLLAGQEEASPQGQGQGGELLGLPRCQGLFLQDFHPLP